MNGYLGEIKMFAGNYPPACWTYCQGQLLPVAGYSSLFAVMGITFGGDGVSTFGLPDLRGRTAIGPGQSPGLSTRYVGMKGGYERIYLYGSQLPSHNHTVNCDMVSDERTESADPEGNIHAKTTAGVSYASNFTGGHVMNDDILNTTGNNVCIHPIFTI